ncbi:hypothetical protein PHMEG_00041063, partial [Phytophthora megakarya]
MTTTTEIAARDQRAERRSAERTATTAKAKQQAPVTVTTVDTDGGGEVTLEGPEIRSTTGNTPLGSSGGFSFVDMGTGGSRSERQPGNDDGDQPVSTVVNLAIETGDRRGNHPVAATRNANDGGNHSGNAGRTGGNDGAGAERVPPPQGTGPPTVPSTAGLGTASQQIVLRERAKSLKLTKFKGLDDTMPVTMWLKTVRAEIRRQAVTSGTQWADAQLYHEVAAHLDGEAQRWFATVMESVSRENENITTLSTMLRTKYMTQRSGPEVVDLLNARRQMRGERLVDYAQSLREIAERGEIG